MTKEQDLRNRLEALSSFLEKVLEDIENHKKIPELEVMEQDVVKLCAEIETLVPELAHTMKPQMGEIITRLDTLADHLMALKEEEKKTQ